MLGKKERAGTGPVPADTLKAFSFWRENGNILESRFKTLTYILHVKSLKDWVQHCIKLQNLQIFEWFCKRAAASHLALTGCHNFVT